MAKRVSNHITEVVSGTARAHEIAQRGSGLRAMAPMDAYVASGRANPRSLPENVAVKFVEEGEDTYHESDSGKAIVFALPAELPDLSELTEAEMEEAAGGTKSI